MNRIALVFPAAVQRGVRLFCRAWLALVAALAGLPALADSTDFRPAFYYGPLPFPQALRSFDTWIVEPGNIHDPKFIAQNRDKLFAYVSLGEVVESRPYFPRIPQSWLVGTNPAWKSRVIDQSADGWPEFFVEQVIAPLRKQGYRHFFLDTLDSYHLIASTPEARRKQEQGMVEAIRLLKARFPDAKLIFNRGFEILPQIEKLVHAVAVESLFQSWNNAENRYTSVSESDRAWLLGQLARVRDEYKLPVIVIDYVPPADRAKAREVAEKIRKLGFVPWVTNPELTAVGVGNVDSQPRKILMLFENSESGDPLKDNDIHRFVAMPANYLGYVPEYHNIHEKPLPDFPLAGRYAGIVTWFNSSRVRNSAELSDWLLRQVNDGVPVAVLGYFGFDLTGKTGTRLGLSAQNQPARGPVRVVSRQPSAAYEISPLPTQDEFFPLRAGAKADVWLSIHDGVSQQDAVAVMPWGGYALAPFTVTRLPDSEFSRWNIDPMAFFSQALQLPKLPVPDVTTENGRRLLITHIDGDGFASRAEFPGAPWAAEMLYREILQRYTLPTTVSIIEGETSREGAYPWLSKQQEAIARRIFRLPHVEAASHSFSHPFRWQPLKAQGQGEGLNLPIPGYVYDDAREIDGSVRYVESLLPPGKRCRVFLWSGDCNPDRGTLAHTYASGLLNMNGGETLITRANPTLTAVAPLGLDRDGSFQVYAPMQNENRYTNLWTGPFYGYERVIETFELTEKPRRLKPINIYYHTYSASKPASLRALQRVYNWALKQPVLPVYASTYIRKVLDFNELGIAREGDGWRIDGGNEVRTLRITPDMGYPDLARSRGVLGWKDTGESRYVHLAGGTSSYLVLADKPARLPYLIESNARITLTSKGWKLDAAQPIEIRFGQASSCRYRINGKAVETRTAGDGSLTLVHPARSALLEAHCA